LMRKDLEDRLAELGDLSEKEKEVYDTIRRVYSSPVYRGDILESIDLNENGYIDAEDSANFEYLVELYNRMDINSMERVELDIVDADTEVEIYGKPYDVVFNEAAGEFDIMKRGGTYSVTVADGMNIVLDDVQISYTASIYDADIDGRMGKKLTLTRDTAFTAAGKPETGVPVNMMIHGRDYVVEKTGSSLYSFTADGDTFDSILLGQLKKV